MGNDADKISEMFLFYLKGKGSGFLVDSHPSQQDIQWILDKRESETMAFGAGPLCVR